MMGFAKRHADPLIPLIGCVLLIGFGALFFPKFLTATYLLQQVQIAAFLGVIATGAMVVILLGQIDLSIPWTLGGAAIISTAMAASGHTALEVLAIPAGLGFGLLVGVINGVGVAVFRIPAMVWTLSVNAMLLGLAVINTGGFNPKGEASGLMIAVATKTTLGIPNAALLWLAYGAGVLWLFRRTTFGRALFAIGNSEKASFLSGVNTTRVIFAAFALAGFSSALGGLLLAGYANQAYQSMGDPYLLPAIAAVVIGGTSILGGRGSYAGTVAGTLFVTLLTSVLSVFQIDPAWRQILFGAIIVAMLLTQRRRIM
ncbi:ABC transporter permease [Actibacterium mucosum KCTC 23349]|uniref:ABC transporter permease n=2 Tax=Actibacterium TaxID=1433986 RepID=A0A037ZH63_9RHOB|nr:ABC transporter permease [Actibacterium mucosum KCTC 23349]